MKVPPPRKFPRTRGGATPVNIHTKPRANNRIRFADPVSASQESSSFPADQPTAALGPSSVPEQPSASQEDMTSASNPRQRQRGKASQRGTRPIFGVGAEESRSSRPADRRIYPQSELRGFTTLRRMRLVRL